MQWARCWACLSTWSVQGLAQRMGVKPRCLLEEASTEKHSLQKQQGGEHRAKLCLRKEIGRTGKTAVSGVERR